MRRPPFWATLLVVLVLAAVSVIMLTYTSTLQVAYRPALTIDERLRELEAQLAEVEQTARDAVHQRKAALSRRPTAPPVRSSTTLTEARQQLQLPRFRSDGRCGPLYPAPGAPTFGECDPAGYGEGVGPCCHPVLGRCSNIRSAPFDHCGCDDCIDFSNPAAAKAALMSANSTPTAAASTRNAPTTSNLNAAQQPAGTLKRFRDDGRCGPNFPAPGAPAFGECDPAGDEDQKGPCCNPGSGWCGNIRHTRWGHCDCKDCIDYKFSSVDNDAVRLKGQPEAIAKSNIVTKAKEEPQVPNQPLEPARIQPAAVDLNQFRDPAKFHANGQCGPKHGTLQNPLFGECDPTADDPSRGPCCDTRVGRCGNDRYDQDDIPAPILPLDLSNRSTPESTCRCIDCVDFSDRRNQVKSIYTCISSIT